MGYHHRARNELTLFLDKGKRTLLDSCTPDVLKVSSTFNGYRTESRLS